MFKNNQTLRKFVGAITLIALAIIVTTMAPLVSASSPKAIAQERTEVVKLEQPSFNQSLSPDSQQLAQLNWPFTDVKSSDYYYQALENLVNRWGCIGGYPDGTFRPQQPLTRGDFVAMLNSCLDQVQFLIQQSRE
jgi:hypothetical protein